MTLHVCTYVRTYVPNQGPFYPLCEGALHRRLLSRGGPPFDGRRGAYCGTWRYDHGGNLRHPRARATRGQGGTLHQHSPPHCDKGRALPDTCVCFRKGAGVAPNPRCVCVRACVYLNIEQAVTYIAILCRQDVLRHVYMLLYKLVEDYRSAISSVMNCCSYSSHPSVDSCECLPSLSPPRRLLGRSSWAA